MTIWIRNCDEADDLDTTFESALADGELTPEEVREIRLKLLRNARRHDENRSLISLAISYLNGGEEARANPFSEVSRKQRRHAAVGYPTLPEKVGVS